MVIPSIKSSSIFLILTLGWTVILLSGGGTNTFSAVLALIITGVGAVLFPPRSLPGKSLSIVIGLFTAWVLATSLLPMPFATASQWIAGVANLDLPATISAQPRHSLERTVYFLCFLVWFLIILDSSLARSDRSKAIHRIHVILSCVAIVVITGVILQFQHPFIWGTHRFSFFPNHNQTGAVLAMGGILAMGWIVRSMRHRNWQMILYMLSFGVFCFAIFLGMSRSAVIFLAAGSCLVILTVFESKNPRFYFKLGIPFGFLLLAVFLVYGGQLLDEFTHILRDGGMREEMRFRIFSDSLRLIGLFPVFGVGVGNFRYFFAQFQNNADTDQLIFHPESDFLWIWAELGLPGIVLLGVGMFLLWRRLELLRAFHSRSSRLPCGIAALLFMVVGLIEVSGHRLGTVLLALLLYGLAQPDVVPRLASRWLPIGVRFTGGMFLLLGGLWVLAIAKGKHATTEEIFAFMNEQGRTLQDLDDLDAWLERLPLAARFHHLAGWRSMAGGEEGVKDASVSFERFQALAPRRWRQLIEHGMAVYPYDYNLALTYWEKAIFRSGDEAVGAFKIIARHMTPKDYPRLRELTIGSSDLRFAYYAGLRRDRALFNREFGIELAMNPRLAGFGTEQKRSLLWQYGEHQGIGGLANLKQQNPAFGSDHWMIMALLEAESGRFEQAVDLAVTMLPEPSMVDLVGGRNLSVIRAHYLMDSMDPLKVIALVQKQKEDGLYREALVIIEVAARKGIRHPYLEYQVAWLHFQLGHYEDSWNLFRDRIRNSLVWD